jgi:hypothetical protein
MDSSVRSSEPRTESRVSWKDILWVVGSAGAAFLALSYFTGASSMRKQTERGESPVWNQGTISAGYVASQLREIDKTRASLIISYDLENNTDADYRLADGPGVVILSRLKSNGSFSQEQPIRLSYPVFLPARQRARLAIEITQPFNWPGAEDAAYLDKMRTFVRQRLENVGEFVLFDQTNHWQLELPSGWDQLQDTPPSEQAMPHPGRKNAAGGPQ